MFELVRLISFHSSERVSNDDDELNLNALGKRGELTLRFEKGRPQRSNPGGIWRSLERLKVDLLGKQDRTAAPLSHFPASYVVVVVHTRRPANKDGRPSMESVFKTGASLCAID